VRKHSHFQTSLENSSIQTHLVLLCCIKRLCIFGAKGAIQIRYYYYYYYHYKFKFNNNMVDYTLYSSAFEHSLNISYHVASCDILSDTRCHRNFCLSEFLLFDTLFSRVFAVGLFIYWEFDTGRLIVSIVLFSIVI